MSTDWEWIFSSASGRDRLLRGEIEGLQESASSAQAQSARLTSQLTQLSGSLETRLSALAAAFDAYVELGDVREQLAGYPDTSAIRRDAVTAVDSLSRGGRPEPVDHRDLDYWLSYAVNAVIAIVAGSPDPATEQQARGLSPEAELFMVAAAGALGAGAAVAGRVPPLLICDGTLAPRQLAVWRAVVHGVYGPMLPGVGEVWRGAIDTDADGWVSWVRDHGRTPAPLESLRWLDVLTAALTAPTDPTGSGPSIGAPTEPVPADQLRLGPAAEPATTDPSADSRTGLRTLVISLVGQGMGEEAALLERSRILRAKIEDPTGPDPAAVAAELPERSVTDEVRDSLLAAAPGSPVQCELLDWVRPGLLAATAALAEAARVERSTDVTVRTDAGLVEVSERGVDQQRMSRAEATLAEQNFAPRRWVLVPGVIAVVVAVLALLAGINDHPRGAMLLLLAAVISVGVSLNALRLRRLAAQRLGDMLADLHRQLTEGQRKAQLAKQAQQEVMLEAAQTAAKLTDRLRSERLESARLPADGVTPDRKAAPI